MVLVQPCAGQSGTWTRPAASTPHAIITRRRCCPTARCSSRAVYGTSSALASAELYDPASGTWTATGSLATATLSSHGDVAAQRQGARRRRLKTPERLASAELYDPASGTWTATGSLGTGRYFHTATLLPNGKVLVAGGLDSSGFLASAELYDPATGTWTRHRQPRHRTLSSHGDVAAQRQGARRRRFQQPRRFSRERGTLRSGERDLDGYRQPRHRTRLSHGDVAAQRQGARRRRLQLDRRLSRERGTLRSGRRDLDGHRQPRHRTLRFTRRRCCPTARCSSQAELAAAALSQARNSTIRQAGSGRPPAASTPHAVLVTRRRCCPTARCSSQAGYGSGSLASAELYVSDGGGGLTLVSAASLGRGGFAIDLPLTGPSGVEDRSVFRPTKKLTITMTFNNAIASVGSASSGCGSVSGININGNSVRVKVSGVPKGCNGQRRRRDRH